MATNIETGKESTFNEDHLYCAFIALLILTILLLLYVFRFLDNNSLVSWQWVFVDFPAFKFFLIITAGVALAYPLSLITLSTRFSFASIIIASFIIATYFWKEPEVIIDASRYFSQAKYLELYGVVYFFEEWGKEIPAWTDLPLLPFLYGLIFKYFGEHRTYIQIFNTLLYSGTVALTFFIGRTLWNSALGLYASTLLLGFPFLIVQIPLMMIDVATMFIVTLAIFLSIIASQSNKFLYILLASLAISLAVLTKYSNLLMLSIVPITLFFAYKQNIRTVFRKGILIVSGIIFLTGTFFWQHYELVIEQIQLLLEFNAPALYRWQESWISTFLYQIHPIISLSAAIACFIAVRRRDTRFIIICWIWAVLIVVEIKRIRYTMVAFPMLALMSAYAITTIPKLQLRRFVALSIILTATLIAGVAYLPYLIGNSARNIQAAGKHLDLVEASVVEIITLTQNYSTINPSINLSMLDLYTTRGTVFYNRDISDSWRPDDIAKLPWRWTWAIQSPHYYSRKPETTSTVSTVLVVQSEVEQKHPKQVSDRLKHYSETARFTTTNAAFRYRTIVRIFQDNVTNGKNRSD